MTKTLKAAGGRARGRPKLEDAALIESHLLDVALRAFVAHGYGGASMRQIVKLAKISRTTLYARFSSKEALFRAIMHQQIERLSVSAVLSPADGPPGLEAGLKAYANRTLAISFEGDLLAVNRLIYSESRRFPELGAAAAERTQIGIAHIARFIQHCAAADKIPCRDPDTAAEAFILMLRGWYVNVMLTNRAVPAAERERWVERAVHVMLAARDGW
jgi:TetR/AcrR family transcriptional regulator, mexJK operon transcriptional repressor